MEEIQQITLDQWMAWKEDIREKLRETAGNFVYIGFRLKQIRDSGMFDGAADIFEFALAEYGLSKSSTSRFIAINERFSEGGNSIELREEYKAIGSSKLAEMLTLTDAECRMITARTTVAEIRDLKNFSRQQPSGDAEPGGQGDLSPLQKCIVEYFRDKKDMLNAVIRAWHEDAIKLAAETMNPSGYATYKKGLCYLFMYEYEKGATAKIITEPEPRQMTWEELLAEIDLIFGSSYESGEDDVHGAYYGTTANADKNVQAVQAPKQAAETPGKPETAESQNTEAPDAPVATSQQQEQEEVEKRERKQKKDKTPKESKAAENQSAEGPGASVATSQQEELEEDEADDKLGAIWVQIEDLEENIANFVDYYNADDAANRDISIDALKKAYKNAIDLAAGLESLLMDAERREKADE